MFRYGTYPVSRSKRSGFLRNIAVALGNAADPESIPHLKQVLDCETDWLVRAHTAWALGQIHDKQAIRVLEKFRRIEPDERVMDEINLALEGV